MGWSWLWDLPVGLLTILFVERASTKLSGLAHEAVHHILFRNRSFNDLTSDLLCMFPLYSSTHHYRLQHLAHHQFVNDPVRDPEVSQLKTSGHWLNFPVGKAASSCGRWPSCFVVAEPDPFHPHPRGLQRHGNRQKPVHAQGLEAVEIPRRRRRPLPAVASGRLYGPGVVRRPDCGWPSFRPCCGRAITVAYLRLPESKYHQSRVHPVIPARVAAVLRITYITLVYAALAWITWATGVWAAVYYFFFWLVPIFTSFSFCMILRQIVQHGNGGRGWLTNTRVFLIRPLIRFSVFPIGQDYHLPHHLFATIPHYQLRKLHELLLEYPEYREQAVVVEGYFLPPHTPQTRPTVLDVLGPNYAPRDVRDVHIDNTVLEDDVVEEKADILREGEMEKKRLAAPAGDHVSAG